MNLVPLPEPNTPWPPQQWQQVYDSYRAWSAWYSGDTDELTKVYGVTSGYLPDPRPSQLAGGIVGRVSRWFWGTPQRQPRSHKLHVPAASDVASTSADLLFAQPPTISADENDTATQERLDELFGPDTTAALIDAAEVSAALSGVFLRAGWDRDIADRPLPSAVHPDAAVPTFRWGSLAEVTFHRTLAEHDRQMLRHLEHHSPGVVQHGLYLGDRDNLGRQVPLTEHPETARLAEGLAEDGQSIPTGLDGLDVVYVPNATPSRIWRAHPQAAHLGRSDLSGVEPLMDALDEAYTSWMRDVRLAKARLIVPEHYLETMGRGQGAIFDADREVFTGMNMLGGKEGGDITPSQFAIRHQEHAATTAELWHRIVTGAGYSAQTFGLTGEVAMTATESNARERQSMLTRGKKVRLWRMGIARLAEVMLQLDRAQFGTGVTPQRPDVDFPPAVSEQPRERAETARMLADANAASTETLVRSVHPDWDDDRVQDEVDAITAARPSPPEMGLP